MRVQWYPGHMAKTRRMMQAHMALVDILIELLDARIPFSSRNPDIDGLAGDKKRIVVLNKADLAAPDANRLWKAYFAGLGYKTLTLDARVSNGAAGVLDMARELTREKTERQKQRGRIGAPLRAMVAGIPNVGKSTFINQLAGRAGALTGDKPGVTRGRQWIKAGGGLEVLDTPGVLWPKFDDERVGVRLAVTGAVSDEVLDRVTLCEQLLGLLTEINPNTYVKRYKLAEAPYETIQPRAILERIGNARGFKMKGGAPDIERAAAVVLDEYRGGRLGRVTLEYPPGAKKSPNPAPAAAGPPQN